MTIDFANFIDWLASFAEKLLKLFQGFYHDVYKREKFNAAEDKFPTAE